jgi:hypothetical protein
MKNLLDLSPRTTHLKDSTLPVHLSLTNQISQLILPLFAVLPCLAPSTPTFRRRNGILLREASATGAATWSRCRKCGVQPPAPFPSRPGSSTVQSLQCQSAVLCLRCEKGHHTIWEEGRWSGRVCCTPHPCHPPHHLHQCRAGLGQPTPFHQAAWSGKAGTYRTAPKRSAT